MNDRRGGLRRRSLRVLALPVLCLLVGALAWAVADRVRTRSSEALRHALRVQAQVERTLGLLVDAETAVRGFVATGDPAYLEPYDSARTEYPAAVASLQRLVFEESEQRARVASIERLGAAVIDDLDDLTGARTADDPATGDRLADTAAAMDTIRGVFGAMRAEEGAEVAERERRLQRAISASRLALGASVAVGTGGGILGALLFASHISRRVERVEGDARALAAGVAVTECVPGSDEIARLSATLVEVSRLLRERDEQLRSTEERLRLLAEGSDDFFLARFTTVPRPAVEYISRGITDITGWPPEAYYDDPDLWMRCVHPDDRELMTTRPRPVTVRFVRPNGDVTWVSLRGVEILNDDGSLVGVEAIGYDVSERRRYEEELTRRALHDDLTSLPNRALFMDRLRHSLAHARRDRRRPAVLFLDLDNFKHVNDGIGHSAGDDVLRQAAARLERSVRAADTVARFGGDEFAVLCEAPVSTLMAVDIATRIVHAMREPFALGEHEVVVTASVGVNLADAPEDGVEDILRDADAAMYRAKAEGKDRVAVFDEALAGQAAARLALERDLRMAVDRDELSLVFQPEVDLRTGDVVGLEALLRWENAVRGPVPPAEFVPLAEESGLIDRIGSWVLRSAVDQLEAWHDRHGERTPMLAVNVSGRQFVRAGFVDEVRSVLAGRRFPAWLLCLEITETILMADPAASQRNAADLRRLGTRLALDDFGTRYSSLAYVRRFPLDFLKIDRAFVAGIAEHAEDAAIVKSIIALARAIGISVIAEGVESEVQVERLRHFGCPTAQGFHFARPLPAADVDDLLGGALARSAG